MRNPVFLVIALLMGLVSASSMAQTAITYQGELLDDSGPANGTVAMEFMLYDDEGGTDLLGMDGPQTVEVNDGLFQVELDFGSVYSDPPVYLQIVVDGTPLLDLQKITPAPAAVSAATASSAATAATADSADSASSVPWSGVTDAPGFWRLGGNAGTTPGSDFIGTSDNTPLVLQVNGSRALKLGVPTDDDSGFEAGGNFVAGHPNNTVNNDSVGVVIGGGGTVAGFENTVGGNFATVGGGADNTASGRVATVAGGAGNEASALQATVGGGDDNTASGALATVPGGDDNCAGGNFSMAMGRQAKVRPGSDPNDTSSCDFLSSYPGGDGDTGTFVWADDSGSDFVSTGSKQFLVRAAGGAGIGTNTPAAQLHAENDSDSGLTTPTLRAENRSMGAGIAGYFLTHGSDTTMILANRDGKGQLLKGFGNNGGNREFEIRNDGSMNFFDGNNRTVNIDAPNGDINVDGSFSSTGADYAELLPRADAAESLRAGDVVGVTGGRITRSTRGADRLMIVSTNPAVLGNRDHDRAQSDHSPVAYLGQVPVRVRGRAAIGDLIVASGQHDGTARAVRVSDWDPERHGPIAGRAWSDKSTAGVGSVTASVGGPRTAALVERLQAQQTRTAALEERLEAGNTELEQRLTVLEAENVRLRERVGRNAEMARRNAELEARLAALEAVLFEQRRVAERQ